MAEHMFTEAEVLEQLSSNGEDDDSTADPTFAETDTERECSTSDSETGETEKAKKPRKRQRNKSKRAMNKEQKNRGDSYVSSSGKKVKEASIGHACSCTRKCMDELGDERVKCIFDGFWKLSNRDKQNSYLFGCLEVSTVKRRYTDKAQTKRKVSVVYSVQSSDGRIQVCKTAFLSMHGLQKNTGRVNNVVNLIKEGHSSPQLDRRGKHSTRPHAYTLSRVDAVRDHIRSLPTYTSHYSRKKNADKSYMSFDYSIASCFKDYKNVFCVEHGYEPVSADKYRRIFTEEFNISFKSPKSDTCKVCDKFQIDLQQAKLENDDIQVAEILHQQELHQRKAAAGQENIKLQTEISRSSDEPYHVITFDLQQALPTPKLSTGPAFYKRKIWTYNLNVHDCRDEKGYCFLWDESIASRGSEEIGSCIKKYIEDRDLKGGVLVAISDNCAGQNKNWTIQFLWLYFLASGRFDRIEHHFPLSGHSMLPSDRDFALIENHVRHRFQYVYTPEHWKDVIRQSSPKLEVQEMSSKDFYKLSDLRDKFTVRTKATDGYPVRFKEVVRFQMTSGENFGIIQTSSSFNSDVWTAISVNKRGAQKDVCGFQFKQKHLAARKIDKAKHADVMSLLPYIPPLHHQFYQSLKEVSNVEDSEDDSLNIE